MHIYIYIYIYIYIDTSIHRYIHTLSTLHLTTSMAWGSSNVQPSRQEEIAR